MPGMLQKELTDAGVDVAGIVEKLGMDDDMLLYFMKKFLNDTNYQQLLDAMREQDMEAALTFAHTLKGMTGNLGMNRLFQCLEKMVAIFRGQQTGNLEELMATVTVEYERICAVIKKDL